MEITGATHYYTFSPIYTIVFLVLVGFIYHLIRNNEYKNTLRASIIIGFVLSLLSILTSNMDFYSLSYDLKVIQWTLFTLILVMIGGFLAVGLKNLANKNSMEIFQESPPENLSKDSQKWWYKQTPRTQAMVVVSICLLCLILITCTICLLNPVKDPVQLSISLPLLNQTEVEEAMKEGTNFIFIANNTTQYTLKGSSEANATVKITSSDLGIYNQTIPLDAENRFTYNLNIPPNVSIIKITLLATKTGKDNSSVNLSIKKQTQ